MRDTFISRNYNPHDIAATYVRYCRAEDTFYFCETSLSHGLDLRQGTMDRKELPVRIQKAAEERAEWFPSYVLLCNGGAR